MKLVKARSRQGTSSLELTIPVDIAKEIGIKAGDYFVIDFSRSEKQLTYKKVEL